MADGVDSARDSSEYPVSEYLTVQRGETIYKTGEWWKAAVTYKASENADEEIAIYLWHNDDGEWKRKQKYLIRSEDTWATDRERIEKFLASESGDPPVGDGDPMSVPVSEFFTVGDATTVFKTDEWWKAVVRIDQKGDWETREVVVYVWQCIDDEWRRRQKYAIKGESDWEEESELIDAYLDQLPGKTAEDVESDDSANIEERREQLQKKLRRQHIGDQVET
jgi:hypothetical protein